MKLALHGHQIWHCLDGNLVQHTMSGVGLHPVIVGTLYLGCFHGGPKAACDSTKRTLHYAMHAHLAHVDSDLHFVACHSFINDAVSLTKCRS